MSTPSSRNKFGEAESSKKEADPPQNSSASSRQQEWHNSDAGPAPSRCDSQSGGFGSIAGTGGDVGDWGMRSQILGQPAPEWNASNSAESELFKNPKNPNLIPTLNVRNSQRSYFPVHPERMFGSMRSPPVVSDAHTVVYHGEDTVDAQTGLEKILRLKRITEEDALRSPAESLRRTGWGNDWRKPTAYPEPAAPGKSPCFSSGVQETAKAHGDDVSRGGGEGDDKELTNVPADQDPGAGFDHTTMDKEKNDFTSPKPRFPNKAEKMEMPVSRMPIKKAFAPHHPYYLNQAVNLEPEAAQPVNPYSTAYFDKATSAYLQQLRTDLTVMLVHAEQRLDAKIAELKQDDRKMMELEIRSKISQEQNEEYGKEIMKLQAEVELLKKE